MLKGFRVSGLTKLLSAGAAALLLAGCNSAGSKIGNLIAFNSPTPPPVMDMSPVDKVECPFIDVPEGGAAVRLMSGSEVRHQYSLGDMSRECTVANKQIGIKVGVSGRVLAGRAGGSGKFTVPVRVGIRRESDQKVLTSKLYQIPATIPQGQLQTTFAFVADPLYVPYTREQANEDYMVVVGFDQGGRRR